MSSSDEQKGVDPSAGPTPPEPETESPDSAGKDPPQDVTPEGSPEESPKPETNPSVADDSYQYESYEESYTYPLEGSASSEATVPAVVPAPPPSPPATTTAGGPTEEPDDEEDGMLRMSFLEHLEELRSRLMKSLLGIGIAFAASLVFAHQLWKAVSAPAVKALAAIGADPTLAQITPMDAFTTIYVKLPMLAALFLASPWILYQVWSFIAPGLYKRERRWAGPFVISTAGLFILGGVFAYFVAFRFGLEFLLGLGRDINVRPVVSLVEYFDLFVNVMLGVGIVFELPVLIFFLTLLRIVTPGFLLRNSRYAILIIVAVAAVVTPTPDIFNLMLFSVPMVLLFYVGIFASYLLTLHRENKRFPWAILLGIVGSILALAAGVVYLAVSQYGYKLVPFWPFFTR
jgi:sec-independent protein translocase protein TatC